MIRQKLSVRVVSWASRYARVEGKQVESDRKANVSRERYRLGPSTLQAQAGTLSSMLRQSHLLMQKI